MTDTPTPKPDAQTTDTTEEAAVTPLSAPGPEVLGEPGADDPDASELAGDGPPELAGDDDLDVLLDLVDERLGYEVDRVAVVVEWLSRRGVRLALAQRRKLGAS